MGPKLLSKWRWLRVLGIWGIALIVAGFATACAEKTQPQPTATPTIAPTAAAAATATATATPRPLALLKTDPEGGYVNSSFTVTGEGLPPGKSVDLAWTTWDGAFDTKVMAETVEYVGINYVEKRVSLGKATTDAQGKLKVDLKAPVDYGGAHSLYVVVDGQDIAKGGFQIRRSISVSPTEGPIGTPINISVTGLGRPPVEHLLSVRYDNVYTGYISGVDTRGMAKASIRAAGVPGIHAIELSGAGNHGAGYLNNQQSPYAQFFPKDGAFRFTFNVTADNGAPPATVELPDAKNIAKLADDAPRTTGGKATLAKTVTATLEPSRGPIQTPTTVTARGLRPNTEVEMIWMTAKGNRVTAAGWELAKTPLGTAKTDAEGTLRTTIKVPDGLGGWHRIALAQEGAVVAELPFFYVHPSLVGVTPTKVKAGEQVTVQLKGIGWTELDNTVAVVYDNNYMGYACGFNSNGDITLKITATGDPGTHLIDIYPTTFQGKATGRWGFQMPQLNALEDHPGLSLGYSLPVFRLAIEVVK